VGGTGLVLDWEASAWMSHLPERCPHLKSWHVGCTPPAHEDSRKPGPEDQSMNEGGSRWANALLSGLAGATALTVIHESARRIRGDAPRMDTLGRRSIARGMEAAGLEPPADDRLQVAALAGDVVSNSLYYSLIGLGGPSGSLARGAALGAVAGLGAVALPPLMGLGHRPGARTVPTAVMTFGWYLAGGLAAAAAYQRLASRGR
jgi:hypothetical protein